MAIVLSCWKDIASYLGKGVRTVQRWEIEDGLPVRRGNQNGIKQPVFAIPGEIDAWIHMRQRRDGIVARESDDLFSLQREIEKLRAEVEQCRARETERSAQELEISLIVESRRLMRESLLTCKEHGDTVVRSRELREQLHTVSLSSLKLLNISKVEFESFRRPSV
jgi:hypothetical protein